MAVDEKQVQGGGDADVGYSRIGCAGDAEGGIATKNQLQATLATQATAMLMTGILGFFKPGG